MAEVDTEGYGYEDEEEQEVALPDGTAHEPALSSHVPDRLCVFVRVCRTVGVSTVYVCQLRFQVQV
jgi:hypothetical protein